MRYVFAALIVTRLLSFPAAAQIDDKVADRLWESTKMLEEMLNAPDGGIPEDLLQRAECVAVVPGVKRAAFGLGVRYGRGLLTCRRADDSGFWGAPSMLSLSGGGFGFQFGGQSTDVLIVLTNPDGLRPLLEDQLTIGADVAATAGPKGRAVGAETSATMRSEILTFARSRGLFAGVSLEGTVLKTDHDANESLYGRAVDPYQVLASSQVEVPQLAERFVSELNRVAYRPTPPSSED